ncbi:MAG: glutamate--tRNA ligase [Candidatus Aminicenantes bacterium]|nr:glutamate--tRNA ligase [Candidatus Aminicenantes bacterium]
MKIRVRFAPSPTGFLHVGNARTALFNWLFARQANGVFVLRIEDTDRERSADKYEKSLMDDLRWLGLDWDEGPDVGGHFGPYRQSQRLEIYKGYTQSLLDKGKAYYCFCPPEELEKTREESIALGKMAVYSGKCRSLSPEESRRRVDSGEEAAIRLRTPDSGSLDYHDLVRGKLSFDLGLIGDPVIVRSNGLPAYNYAVVIDDLLMEITHVIRGEDHISNTPRQLLAYKALDFSPPQFAHLSMVMGKDNTRLSKRHGAAAVEQFKKDGFLSSALFNYLSLLGWASPDGQEVLAKNELVRLFDLEKVSRSSAIFDYDKFNWINRQHIKKLTPSQKAELAYPHLRRAGFLPEKTAEAQQEWLERMVEVLSNRIDRFSDLPQEARVFFVFTPQEMDEEARKELEAGCAPQVIGHFAEKISQVKEFNYDRFAAFAQEIREETGCKGKDLYHPLRIVLTAKASGLELDKLIPLVEEGARLDFPLPVKNCSQRVSEVLEVLKK